MSNIDQNKFEGCFHVSRSIFTSEIWSKPDWYLKVWLYLIGKANHRDIGNFKRGEYFLKGGYRELQEVLMKRGGFGKKRTEKCAMSRCISYMVSAQLISVRKTTVGMYIKILNYNDYQDISNYETQPEEKRRRNSHATVTQLNASSINKNERMKERITTGKPVVGEKRNIQVAALRNTSEEKPSKKLNSSNDLMKNLLKNIEERKKTGRSPGEEWQNLAAKWATKLKLNQVDTKTLFGMFKRSKSNCFEIERLCSLALESNAENPIGYMLWKRKEEKKQLAINKLK